MQTVLVDLLPLLKVGKRNYIEGAEVKRDILRCLFTEKKNKIQYALSLNQIIQYVQSGHFRIWEQGDFRGFACGIDLRVQRAKRC